jgi:hypothetical protein
MGRPEKQRAILAELIEMAAAAAEEARAAEQARIDMEAATAETLAYEERKFDETVDKAWAEMQDKSLGPEQWLVRHKKDIDARNIYFALRDKLEEAEYDAPNDDPELDWGYDYYQMVPYRAEV